MVACNLNYSVTGDRRTMAQGQIGQKHKIISEKKHKRTGDMAQVVDDNRWIDR
jgi:hypothetical protein